MPVKSTRFTLDHPPARAPQYTVYTVYWGARAGGWSSVNRVLLTGILNRFKKYLHKIIGWTE